MHLEIASHSARNGFIASDTVKRSLQLCPKQLPLRVCVLTYYSYCCLLFLARTRCGRGSRAQCDRSLGGLGALWRGAVVHCPSRVSPSHAVLCVELWEMLQRQRHITPVLQTGTLHIKQNCGFSRIKNSVVRSGRELYLLYLPLPPFLPLIQIIFFISFEFVCLFIKSPN